MTETAEHFRIDVDVRRALDVLSGSVFAGRQSCIREIIANAADGLTLLFGHEVAGAEIRLNSDVARRALVISDNGIGMTRAEARAQLGTIFATGKEGLEGVVGRFGIGFYSCFPLCSEVEVLTRTRTPGDEGTRVRYSGGQMLEVAQWPVENPGTTVKLLLKPEHEALLDEALLLDFVRKDCNFVRFPIYLAGRQGIANAMDGPWYHDSSEADLRAGLKQFFNTEDPLAVFPIHRNPGADGRYKGQVHGILYIGSSQKRASLRLYSHRILVTESETSLFDEKTRAFVSGVIDAEDLPLVISRDAILERSSQAEHLQNVLLEFLGEGLAALASQRRKDFRRLMAEHGSAIKVACLEHSSLLDKLCDQFPYRSSLRASVTVPEYLQRRSDNTVIYADDVSVGASLIPLYNQRNIEVLYMTDAADALLRDQWRIGGRPIRFKRLDLDPPAASEKEASSHGIETKRSVVEALRMLFQARVNKNLRVEVRSLGVDGPPAVLALSDDDRQKLQLVEAVRLCEKQGLLTELPAEVQAAAKAGMLELLPEQTTQTVILNETNDVVGELIHMLGVETSAKEGTPIEPLLAAFLYGQALLASGLQLSSEKLTEISHDQTRLLATLLRRSSKASGGDAGRKRSLWDWLRVRR